MPQTDASLNRTLTDAGPVSWSLGGVAGTGPRVPETIGPYRLLEPLGEGGCGLVFLAEQSTPVQRRVALKVIKPGMDSRAVLARFEAERQALAVMDHPWLAKVFDGGCTADGRPYFVMELVDGEPVTRYCDAHRLDVRARVALVERICRAVQHAHGKGVIHRDLKPSNILVVAPAADEPAAAATPRVIDFGVAKALHGPLTEHTLLTEAGQPIGTLDYMAPEQAALDGDLDVRADVYSLGIVLYELLTGSRPFAQAALRAGSLADLQQLIRDSEPQPPSARAATASPPVAELRGCEPAALRRQLAGDLDWIVLRCLDKQRNRRYDTAAALADDLNRYLAGEPVMAGPPSAGYRLGKFIRRNRIAVAAGSAVLLALLATLLSVSLALSESLRQRERAEAAQQAADQRAAQLAQVVRFQAGQLADIDVAAMGESLRRRLLAGQSAEAGARLQALLAPVNFTDLALDTLDETIFARARAAIERDMHGQPLLQAKLLQTLAATMRELGLIEQAAEPQRRALALFRQQLGAEHPDTLHAESESAMQAWREGDTGAAEQQMNAVLGHWRRLDNDDDALAEALHQVGFFIQHQGRWQEAELYFREALARLERAHGPRDPAVLDALGDLGELLDQLDRQDEAEPLLRRSLDGYRALYGEHHASTLLARYRLAQLLRSRGDLDEAADDYRRVLDGRRQLLGERHPATLVAENNLGWVLLDMGRIDQAEPLLRDALQRRLDTLGERHPDTIVSLNNVGVLSKARHRYAEAEALYRRAIAASLAENGPDSPATLRFRSNLGELLADRGRLAEAERELDDVRERRQRVLGAAHIDTLRSVFGLARVLAARGRVDQALALTEPNWPQLAALPRDHVLRASLEFDHVAVLLAAGRRDQARQELDEAEQALTTRYGHDHWRLDMVAPLRAALQHASG